MTSYSHTTALPLPSSTPPARHLASAAAQILCWLATALVVAGLLAVALGFLGHSAPQLAQVGTFAGKSYPVRPIEWDNGAVSSKGLVRVPCGGRARGVSVCWVARPTHNGR